MFPDLLSVCAEIDHVATRNMIDMQYATPWPWHVLISWSPNHVIYHPGHLVIPVFYIHIIIPMQIPCQSLEPIVGNTHIYPLLPCGFSPTIPSIASSSFYSSSLPLFYFWNHRKTRMSKKYSYAKWNQIYSRSTQIPIKTIIWIQ
jgi:hypothetical protein